MHDNSTGGRRGISAAIFALLLTTAACGTAQATDPESAVPAPPAVVKQAPAGISADAAERAGQRKGQGGTGGISADAAERAGQRKGQGGTGVTSDKRPGESRRVPDARP